mgnify:CR=1 FL=1
MAWELYGELYWEDVRVFVNNAPYESASVRVERNSGAAASSQDGSFKSGLLVQLADTSPYDDEIRIELGSDPQISVVSPQDEIEALLLDSQVEFAVKDAVWKAVTSKQSNTSKLAHLQSMALDKSLAGPLFELLSADTRLA